MDIFRTAVLALMILDVVLALPARAQGVVVRGASSQSATFNNDRAIAAQVYGGLREGSGETTITFFGNMAFQIESPRGIKVFIDPWRNDITGMYAPWYVRDMPEVRTDIALVTHAHYDHDALERVAAGMVFERMAGSFRLGDVRITGIADKHVCETQGGFAYRDVIKRLTKRDPCPPEEVLQWDNSLYIVETGGLRILHWGDNRQNPPDHVWELVGDVDVAILAVSDNGHILSPEWADFVMKKCNARIVIPGHYFVHGVNIPGAAGLKSAEGWTARHEHTILDAARVTLSPDVVSTHKQHVMYFGNHVAFKTDMSMPVYGTPMPAVPEPARAWQRFHP